MNEISSVVLKQKSKMKVLFVLILCLFLFSMSFHGSMAQGKTTTSPCLAHRGNAVVHPEQILFAEIRGNKRFFTLKFCLILILGKLEKLIKAPLAWHLLLVKNSEKELNELELISIFIF